MTSLVEFPWFYPQNRLTTKRNVLTIQRLTDIINLHGGIVYVS